MVSTQTRWRQDAAWVVAWLSTVKTHAPRRYPRSPTIITAATIAAVIVYAASNVVALQCENENHAAMDEHAASGQWRRRIDFCQPVTRRASTSIADVGVTSGVLE
ncbi:hypothetical protein [Mycobacterium sp. URHB0044]|uniref:hypothetical protein n=1 Tax=Mycobacterium sp. URHB0044 TaxID=1380386 RepID=UPI0012DF8AF6|nr:hypothetical protein [Mycobacterium sp. URHB0044]